MMADQHRHATAFDCRHQFACLIQMHAHRFLQQHRNPGGKAIQRRADVLIIRIGHDHRIGPYLLQHLPVIGEIRHAPLRRQRWSLRAGIGHCAQPGFFEGLQMLVMLLAHVASADQGDTKGRSQGAILL